MPDNEPLVLFGESLGTGVASGVATASIFSDSAAGVSARISTSSAAPSFGSAHSDAGGAPQHD